MAGLVGSEGLTVGVRLVFPKFSGHTIIGPNRRSQTANCKKFRPPFRKDGRGRRWFTSGRFFTACGFALPQSRERRTPLPLAALRAREAAGGGFCHKCKKRRPSLELGQNRPDNGVSKHGFS